jgi:hypothetical protein
MGPDHFSLVYAQTMQMLTTEPEIELTALAVVHAPTLVLQGDRDDVTLEHGGAVAPPSIMGGLRCSPVRTYCLWRVQVWSMRYSSSSSQALI